MKQKFTAWLLTGAFCLSALPEFPARAVNAGLHVGHFDSFAQYQNAAENGILTAASGNVPETRAALPAAFDLREKGLVTPVRNQGSYGMCWSFSAFASLESSLAARNPLVDLSEWHLAYYTYSDVFGFPPEDASTMTDVLKQGGNAYMLSPILTRWVGPVAEETCPFGDFNALNPDATPEMLSQADEYHVTDVNMLDYDITADHFEAQLNAIRQAVYDGHAVAVSYQNRSECYSSGSETFYTDLPDDGSSGYHAVTIVGWDDDFPADRFVIDPGRNGAWLMKNSWGPHWGNNGYFWMSYADASITDCFYVEAEATEVHDGQYRHDDYGYWTAFSVDDNDTSAYVANVFTAQEETWLTSVMFCNAMPEEDYAIQVYSDLNQRSSPTSGKASAKTAGHVSASGYHTVDLDEPVHLTKGQTFSIVVNLSGDEGQHIACEAYMRYVTEAPDGTVDKNETVLPEALLVNTLGEGESFYSINGQDWYDIAEDNVIDDSYTLPSDEGDVTVSIYARIGNLCVRGLTQQPGRVIFSEYDEALPSGTPVALTCPGADAIYYSVNGGEEQRYTEPLVLTEEMTVSARAVSDRTEYPVYTQHYTVQAAQLSSLLDTESSEYLTFEALTENVFVTTVTDAATLSLLPITTGEILCDTADFASGKITQVNCAPPALTLRVRNAGMLESLYVIYLTDDVQGDVNLDGEVDAADAAEILVYAAALGANSLDAPPDAAWLARADYDGNGMVDAPDAAEILIEAARRGAGN